MSSNVVRAVILDLGNVVLEVSHAKMAAAFAAIDPNNIREIEGMERWPEFDAFERGSLSEADFTTFLSDRWSVSLSQENFRAAWNSVFVGPVQGIESVLDYSHSCLPTYALSNTSPVHIEYAKATYPFMNNFEQVLTSYDLKCRKPEPIIFKRTCEILGHPPQELVFVDDLAENVEAARKLGFQAFCCKNNANELQRVLKSALAVNVGFNKRV